MGKIVVSIEDDTVNDAVLFDRINDRLDMTVNQLPQYECWTVTIPADPTALRIVT